MNEAQRYLRYVMPGVLFGVQTLILLWIVLPEWTSEKIIRPLSAKDTSVAIAIASVFVSGALGYVFATFHHWLHWHFPLDRVIIDHSKQIENLRERGLLPPSPSNAPSDKRLEAFDAMTAAWLPRLQENTPIGNAEKRITRFSDLAHSAGAARVATTAAFAIAILTCCLVGKWNLTLGSCFRFIIMLLLGAAIPLLFNEAYGHTGGVSQRVYDRILEETLEKESNTVTSSHESAGQDEEVAAIIKG